MNIITQYCSYCSPGFCYGWEFIAWRSQLEQFQEINDTIMVCSPGRAGSTLLSDVLDNSLPLRTILKSHLLPPNNGWNGKIIYIFSDPDKGAESICHVSLENSIWNVHFEYMETADRIWLKKIGSVVNQTIEDNLLAYDALGIETHLYHWLIHAVEICPLHESNILAIKYEHLWDQDVIIQSGIFILLLRL